MHEAGLIARAIADALAADGRPIEVPAQAPRDGVAEAAGSTGGRARPRRPRAMEIIITDPVRVGAAAAGLYAEMALRRRGLAGVPVEVRVVAVSCPMCGAATEPAPSHPCCERCGWPLQGLEAGQAQLTITARWE